REYNVSRTFYAADGTVEQAAWLMSWITRGDALTTAEVNNPFTIWLPRLQPRFPSETANESIIGVTGTQSQQTAGGQWIFGTPSATATRRQIPFNRVPSFDNPSITVPTWFPMVNTTSYRYDTLDTQLPQVMVHCRVEREDVFDPITNALIRSPRPLDGYMPSIMSNAAGLGPQLLHRGVFNGSDYFIYRDAVNALYIAVPAALSPTSGAAGRTNFVNLINNNFPNELVCDIRYYVIIASAQAEDATSPNHPFRSIARFHYAVIFSQQRQNNTITAANWTTSINSFPVPNTPNIGIPNGYNSFLIINNGAANNLYAPARFHGIFRSRR
ncbi:MAG: hypothetical protein LBO62_06000, partial [Endomicrobium sp.]|nr:hypothetical protein [Endomicrobium sp.]